MEDLFGKDDSDNDDFVEVEEKDDTEAALQQLIAPESFNKKVEEPMEIDNIPLKNEEIEIKDNIREELIIEPQTQEEVVIDTVIESSIDIVKHEIEVSTEQSPAKVTEPEDLFGSDIILPNPVPNVIKDRRESREKSKRELEEEEREKMQVLVSNFTEDQLDRYEMYRRAAFPKAAIKRIMQTITGCSVSQNVVIAMSGIAKVFVGEIVEEALDVMETNNETGPLQPKHLREAVRRLRLQGQIPNGRAHKSFFRL